jgi:GAF domain-containing protein
VLLASIRSRDRPIAVLGLGPREEGRPFGPEEHGFLRRVAACMAAPIENGLLREELRRVHRHLAVKAFEVRSLLDVSRELAGDSAEDAIQGLVVTAAMGHFVVPRCALYLLGPRGLALAHGRGVRPERAPIPPAHARAALEGLTLPVPVAALAEGPLRRRLEEARLVLAVPLVTSGRVEGVLAIGERASGTPFSGEDQEIASTLARQALGALEAARLRRIREQKERQDRELRIAREIQGSLFPRATQCRAGAASPCYRWAATID